MEALFVHLRERVLKHKSDGSTLLVHPLTSIQYWIIPERRIIPQFEGAHYTLQSPQIHLLAKWQAVKTYDQLRNRPANGIFDLPQDSAEESITLYLGRDGESFYLDAATRDIQGVLADNRVCEIDASNVRGYSLSEALRRLDKKEDQMVEAKWKPIMAARREAEEASDERSHTDKQQVGSGKERGDEPKSKPQKEGIEANCSFLQESRQAVPVIYVGNEPTEMNRKRKRDSPDQHARPSSSEPQAPALASPAKTVKKPSQSRAAPHIVHLPSEYTANPQDWASSASRAKDSYPVEGVPGPSAGPRQAGVGCITRVEETSAHRVHELNTNHKSGKEDPRADAYGAKTLMALGSPTGTSPSARPATQPFRPLKYAPKPASKVCNKRNSRATGGAEVQEKQKELPGD